MAGYSPYSVKESDTTERLSTHTHVDKCKCVCISPLCCVLTVESNAAENSRDGRMRSPQIAVGPPCNGCSGARVSPPHTGQWG